MNTTLQIRIDKKIKDQAKKNFEAMGLDLSSGIKYLLIQANKSKDLSYVCEYGYTHRYTSKMAKKYKKEAEWAMKHAKRYDTVEEMLDELEKGIKK